MGFWRDASLPFMLSLMASAAETNRTSVTGYLVDNYCWGLKNHIGLDGANLEKFPEDHTVHCLRDVQLCIDGGYAILEKSAGSIKYHLKYRLDAAGNRDVLEIIKTTPTVRDFQVTATGIPRGGVLTDASIVEAESSGKAGRKEGSAALYLHILFMCWSWGTLLPWGVALASRTRNVKGAVTGAWFALHRKCQYLGWALQLLGFGAAIWHCELYSAHFVGTHTKIGLTVVILGTLQPLNAALRSHPPEGGWPPSGKPLKRKLWEILHKGCGWGAILLGIFNVCVGIMLVNAKGFHYPIIGVAITLGVGTGILPILLFFVVASVRSDNRFSVWCVGLVAPKKLSSKPTCDSSPVLVGNPEVVSTAQEKE